MTFNFLTSLGDKIGDFFDGNDKEDKKTYPQKGNPFSASRALSINSAVGSGRTNKEDDVSAVQTGLSELGYLKNNYRHKPSGIYDRDTDNAIKKFQTDHGLKVDGWMVPSGPTATEIMRVQNGHSKFNPLAGKQRSFDFAKAPIYDLGTDRQRIILNNLPGKFSVYDDPKVKPNKVWNNGMSYLNKDYATEIFNKFSSLVEKYSKEEGVDPNLSKAVLYAETTRGRRWKLDDILDPTDYTETKLPMNINPAIWSSLTESRPYDMFDETKNIRAGIRLLRRISERTVNPTPAKIGALWNGLALDNINEYSSQINQFYKEKPWEK